MQRLPDDLLYWILDLTLPFHSSRSIPTRYRQLLLHSRLNRQFARVAQQLLFLHVDINTYVALEEFIGAVDESPSARRMAFNRTRTVRIAVPDARNKELLIGKQGVEQVLKRTPGVKELWVDGIEVDPLSLSVAMELQVLRLTSLHLVRKPLFFAPSSSASAKQPVDPSKPPPATWYLPRLHSLFFSYMSYVDDKHYFLPLSDLLTPLSLPALSTLAFSWNDQCSLPEFALVASQLTHLWLRRTPTVSRRAAEPPKTILAELPSSEINSCSRDLRHLAIDLRKTADLNAFSEMGSLYLPGRPERHGDTLLARVGWPPQPAQEVDADGREQEDAEADDENENEMCFLRTLRLESPTLITKAESALLQRNPSPMRYLHALLVQDVSELPAEKVIEEGEARETTRVEAVRRGMKLEEWDFTTVMGGQEEKWEQERWRGWCDAMDREVEEKARRWADAEVREVGIVAEEDELEVV